MTIATKLGFGFGFSILSCVDGLVVCHTLPHGSEACGKRQCCVCMCAAQLSAYFLIKTLPFWAQLNGWRRNGGRGNESVYNVKHFATYSVQRAMCNVQLSKIRLLTATATTDSQPKCPAQWLQNAAGQTTKAHKIFNCLSIMSSAHTHTQTD